jgi:hypothetical protein
MEFLAAGVERVGVVVSPERLGEAVARALVSSW